jgi:hypothetical protein
MRVHNIGFVLVEIIFKAQKPEKIFAFRRVEAINGNVFFQPLRHKPYAFYAEDGRLKTFAVVPVAKVYYAVFQAANVKTA